MMPSMEYKGSPVFQSESGRLQFLLMLDDLYFSKYCTRLTRKEWICEQLKQDGFQVIIGLDWQGDEYRLWTPDQDEVSAHICRYPEDAGKSPETIRKILMEEREPKHGSDAHFSDYVLDGLGMEFLAGAECFDPFHEMPTNFETANKTAETGRGRTTVSREKPLDLVYEELSDLLAVLPGALKRWMGAAGKFAFVVEATDWQQILEAEQKLNKERLSEMYRYVICKMKNDSLFLQVIAPVSGWADVYNRALLVPQSWNQLELEKCDEQEAKKAEYLNEWTWKQKAVTYVPSLTVESVERMIWHQYILHHPSISLDFSKVMETAEEIVHLITYEGIVKADYSAASELMVNALRRVDPSYPLRKVEETLFQNKKYWNMFARYIEERPTRYRSWGEIPEERLNALEAHLLAQFVGQDMQIHAFCQAIRQCAERCRNRTARGGSKECGAPMVVFLAGPTRTGKSEIVRQTVDFLFDSRERLHDRFNGAALRKAGSESIILGAGPGLVGYRDRNPFKQFVERGLASILLIDEIHKAHKDVKDLFMPIMEKSNGKLTFSNQDSVYFPEMMIVFTSNNGCQTSVKPDQIPDYEELLEIVMKHYCDETTDDQENGSGFEPAWRSRVDQFICFNYLDEDAVKKLALRELELKQQSYPGLHWEPDVAVCLMKCAMVHRAEGAEQVKHAIERQLTQAFETAKRYQNPFVEQELRLLVLDGSVYARYE